MYLTKKSHAHINEHRIFIIVLFSRCFPATLDPVFDEVVEEEGGAEPEDFEDQANQGKQPFDHVYETLFMHFI